MELTGFITWVGDTQSGISKTGNEWHKREFVVEYESGEHPKRALFAILNDDIMGQLEVGKKVLIKFSINAKEWNGKYFNDFHVWKLKFVTDEQSAQTAQSTPQQTMMPNAPLADPNKPVPTGNDDLPF